MKLLGLRAFRRDIVLVMTASLFAAVSTAAMLASVGMVAQRGVDDHFNALLFCVAFCSFVASSLLSSRVQAAIDANFGYELRLRLVKRILATRFEHLVASNRHDLYNVVTNDVSAITRGVSMIPYFASSLAEILACSAYMAFLAPKLFLLLAAPLAALLFVSQLLTARAYRYGNESRAGLDRMVDGFKGAIDGARELSVNAALRGGFFALLERHAEELRVSTLGMGRAWGWNRTLMSTMLFVILGSVAFFGNALAPPEVIALFIILATYCIGAFNTVLQGVQQLSAARNSMRKIDSLALAPESAIAQAPTPGDAALPTDWRTLSVQGLHYRYPSQDGAEGFAIGPVSVSIGRGELVFVSGGNGSGKSTFMSVLVGLLTPQEGMVQLDGRSVLGEQLASFQNMLGVIHSDFYLFDQVLNANDGSASAEDARRWLGLLELDGIVSVHDGMFSTTKLSRGQRKRLALVAALTADKDIYVLDEWAADQDPYFRDVFYNVVLQQLRARGKTVIAVSHDDRYYHVPDRVLRVDGGRIEDVSAAHAIAEPA